MALGYFAVILTWALFTCTVAFPVETLTSDSEDESDKNPIGDGGMSPLTKEEAIFINTFISDLLKLNRSLENTSETELTHGNDVIGTNSMTDDDNNDDDDKTKENDEDDEDDEASHSSLLNGILSQIKHGHVTQTNVSKWFSQIHNGLSHGTISKNGYQRFLSVLKRPGTSSKWSDICCPFG